eukprot:10285_5
MPHITPEMKPGNMDWRKSCGWLRVYMVMKTAVVKMKMPECEKAKSSSPGSFPLSSSSLYQIWKGIMVKPTMPMDTERIIPTILFFSGFMWLVNSQSPGP